MCVARKSTLPALSSSVGAACSNTMRPPNTMKREHAAPTELKWTHRGVSLFYTHAAPTELIADKKVPYPVICIHHLLSNVLSIT